MAAATGLQTDGVPLLPQLSGLMPLTTQDFMYGMQMPLQPGSPVYFRPGSPMMGGNSTWNNPNLRRQTSRLGPTQGNLFGCPRLRIFGYRFPSLPLCPVCADYTDLVNGEGVGGRGRKRTCILVLPFSPLTLSGGHSQRVCLFGMGLAPRCPCP